MGITSEARRNLKVQPRSRDRDRLHAKTVCVSCGKEKLLTEFHKNGTGKKYAAHDPRRYKKNCASCVRQRMADASAPGFEPKRKRGTPKKYKNAAHKKRATRRAARIKVLHFLAEGGCEHCGTHDPRVLEFDHIEPANKKYNISRLLSGGYKWTSDILQREIRKCRILCANCHRIHTAEQQGQYAHEDVEDTLHEIFRTYGIEP